MQLVQLAGNYNVQQAIEKGLFTKDDYENLNNKNYVVNIGTSYTWIGDPLSKNRSASEFSVEVVSKIEYKEEQDKNYNKRIPVNSLKVYKEGYGSYTALGYGRGNAITNSGYLFASGTDAIEKWFFIQEERKFYKFELLNDTDYCENDLKNYTVYTIHEILDKFRKETLDAIAKDFVNKAYIFHKTQEAVNKGNEEDDGDSKKNTVVVNTPTLERGSLSTYFSNTKQYSSYGDKFNCYLTIKNSEKVVAVMGLPVYPQEFSENNNGQFQSTSILGRSVDYQTYNSSSRTVSVSLTLHEELCHDRLSTLKSQTDTSYDYIHLLVSTIESACYPGYDSNGFVSPPSVILQIGDHFRIEGIMTSVSTSWKAPIIDGKLTNCDVSMSITEISGPYDGSKISSFRGYRT